MIIKEFLNLIYDEQVDSIVIPTVPEETSKIINVSEINQQFISFSLGDKFKFNTEEIEVMYLREYLSKNYSLENPFTENL